MINNLKAILLVKMPVNLSLALYSQTEGKCALYAFAIKCKNLCNVVY